MSRRKSNISIEQGFQLISEVRKRGCLWDTDHERYNDRYQSVKSWMEIAEILKLSEVAVRSKWKNFRDGFKKEVKRYGSVDNYTGKWIYFNELSFLDKPEEDDEKVEEVDETGEDDDEECCFEVEHIKTEEDASNGTEIYLEEHLEEDPIPEKRFKVARESEDSDVMFLTSLAPFFKELDPLRKLVVRSKMQDILLNEIAAQVASDNIHKRKKKMS